MVSVNGAVLEQKIFVNSNGPGGIVLGYSPFPLAALT
jgi:hypothetical protein